VMAPYVLTDALMDQLSAAKGRVVNLVTGIPEGAKATIDELMGDAATAGIGSYTRNKLALAALTGEQQRRYGERGVTVVSLHPGIIPGTRFAADAMPAFLRAIGGFVARLFRFASTLDQAAERYVSMATGEVEPGAFYGQGRLAEPPKQAKDEAFAKLLWERLQLQLGASTNR
jgi:NAD(P)-dependent dehydrogenase (short-subunit alcohol dehydrogenase family)